MNEEDWEGWKKLDRIGDKVRWLVMTYLLLIQKESKKVLAGDISNSVN